MRTKFLVVVVVGSSLFMQGCGMLMFAVYGPAVFLNNDGLDWAHRRTRRGVKPQICEEQVKDPYRQAQEYARQASLLFEQGHLHEATEKFEQAVDIIRPCENTYNVRNILSLEHKLAQFYVRERRFPEAEKVFLHIIALQEPLAAQYKGNDQMQLGYFQAGLRDLYNEMGRTADAKKLDVASQKNLVPW